ncbi:hypothetical protein RCL1_002342 [Eukaryota sp. TZLM3-RCL]
MSSPANRDINIEPGAEYLTVPSVRSTLWKNFSLSAECYPDRNLFGRRFPEPAGQGKYTWSDYQWMSYSEVKALAEKVASALVAEGMQKGDRIAIMSCSRPEWQFVALACQRSGFVVVPLYDNVPSTETSYVLNDADARMVFLDPLRVDTLAAVSFPESVSKIVMFDTTIIDEANINKAKSKHTSLLEGSSPIWQPLSSFIADVSTIVEAAEVDPDDLTALVYTSGTSGNPKGCMLTNTNYLSSALGLIERLPPGHVPFQDVLIAFLPLAHIFEQVLEVTMFMINASIAYYSGDVLRLLDDLKYAKPTFLVGVPRVFSKIVDRINSQVSVSGLKKALFSRALNTKLTALSRSEGTSFGVKFFDALVFKKVAKMFGGRIRAIYSGSAKLDPDVARFITCVLKAPLAEGYGASETSAAGTVDILPDLTGECDLSTHYGTVGFPTGAMSVKIVDVPEMGYTMPKGEILMKGPAVFKGYWKLPEKTAEVLTPDGWYHTGDIGLIDEKGRLSIIDRKSACVKGIQGEFINLSVIEDDLETSDLVDQVICVAGKTTKLIALVTPATSLSESLKKAFEERNETEINSYAERVIASFTEIARQRGHRSFEFVSNIHVCLDGFTVENSLLTASMKKKRGVILQRYKDDVDNLVAALTSKDFQTGTTFSTCSCFAR